MLRNSRRRPSRTPAALGAHRPAIIGRRRSSGSPCGPRPRTVRRGQGRRVSVACCVGFLQATRDFAGVVLIGRCKKLLERLVECGEICTGTERMGTIFSQLFFTVCRVLFLRAPFWTSTPFKGEGGGGPTESREDDARARISAAGQRRCRLWFRAVWSACVVSRAKRRAVGATQFGSDCQAGARRALHGNSGPGRRSVNAVSDSCRYVCSAGSSGAAAAIPLRRDAAVRVAPAAARGRHQDADRVRG